MLNTSLQENVAASPLEAKIDLSRPLPLRVCFPVLLDGDLVMSTEHLGVAYLVAVLRNAGAECRIFELPVGGFVETIKAIADWEPDVIGITLTTISVEQATRFGRDLRARLGERPFIVAGGPLATHLGANLLRLEGWNFLDALVRGEGEVPMLRLAEALHSGSSLDDVPSLSFRTEADVKETELAPTIADLDILPFPVRDQFEFHEKRLAYIRVSTSRGCTARCAFCNAPHARNQIVKGKIWRGASPQHILDEVEHLYRQYNFNTFDFVDSTFEDPGGTPKAKARIAEIAQGLIDRGLKVYYNCCMQAKNWSDADKPLLDLLFRSGLEKVLVGVESGSDIGLKIWGKMSSAADNARIISLLNETGVYTAFGFISFHPWSSFAEIRENYTFLRDNMGHNLRRFTVRLELYPGAEAVGRLREEGLLLPEFDRRLNPLAYKYVDPRIERLAHSLALLYGDQYAADCTIEQEPAVFEFETYDIVLHTYLSRLTRIFGERPEVAEILETAKTAIQQIKGKLTDFNYDLIMKHVEAADQGTLEPDAIRRDAPVVEACYRQHLDELRSIQLRTSMKLHRARVPVKAIQLAS